MKKLKLAVLFSVALLFMIGTVNFSAAAASKAEKKAPSTPSAAEPTRDTRTLFGHNVEGLAPVTIIYSNDASYGSMGDAMVVNFKTLVEAESKGQIKIDAQRFGSLYKLMDHAKVMPSGTIHMGSMVKSLLLARERSIAPWVVSYRMTSPEQMLALVTSAEWYEMEEKWSKDKWNLKPLVNQGVGNWDYFSKVSIRTMQEFKGKKCSSAGGLTNSYISSWGATPVIKSASEIYMAYYSGVIDMVSVDPKRYLDYKFYEGGKYWLHIPGDPPGAVALHNVALCMNRDKWNSLPVAYKKIILDAADLMTWAAIYETACMARLAEYRLVNQHKVVDLGIATKNPKEYEKIKAAAVAAGKKYALSRGATAQQWEEAQALLARYAQPQYASKYGWYFKKTKAESDRRLAAVRKSLAAGKSWDEACDVFDAKHRYSWTAERIKKEWMAVPRVKWEWNEATRLQ